MSAADFTSLLNGPPRADLLAALAKRLRAIAAEAETPARRAEVAAALACRWWGLRGLAICALGAWGGPRNRAWLTERARRSTLSYVEWLGLPRGSPEKWTDEETIVCRRSVSPLVDGGDVGWVLDLWFADFMNFSGLHAALERLPADVVCARIDLELAGAEVDRREAAVWLVFHHPRLDCRQEVFRRLAADPVPKLAARARTLAAIARERERSH